jgi:hypothetical protein
LTTGAETARHVLAPSGHTFQKTITPLAGFRVMIYGRFWVFTEAEKRHDPSFLPVRLLFYVK